LDESKDNVKMKKNVWKQRHIGWRKVRGSEDEKN
jgi:hypothetical protein